MPLVAVVGRKRIGPMFILIFMYALLILGSLTMIYPFLMTLTGSVSNHYDYPKHAIFPSYIFSGEEQFFKYLADKYNPGTVPFTYFSSYTNAPSNWNSWINVANDKNLLKKYYPELLKYRKTEKGMKQLAAMSEDYNKFLKNYASPYNLLNCYGIDFHLKYTGHLEKKYSNKIIEENIDTGDKSISEKALDLMNKKYKQGRLPDFDYLETKYFSRQPYHMRKFYFQDRPNFHDFYDFVKDLPPNKKTPISGKLLWDLFLINNGISLDKYNKEMKTNYTSLKQIPYFTEKPENKWLSKIWNTFHEKYFPLRLVKLKKEAEPFCKKWLKKRFKDINKYNRLVNKNYKSFKNLPFYSTSPQDKLERNFWNDFVNTLPLKLIYLRSPEALFQKQLKEKYTSIGKLNQTWGTSYKQFSHIQFPIIETDYYYWMNHKWKLLFRYLTINFRMVFQFMATRGRALFNTLILVSFTILCTLTVNPLAAYALSRFKLRFTNQILIYFLATMAFPPAVTMIPSFLLLRDFNLLNTYGALILPRLANAYSIFLLKGFFDSIPRELYEAATIDGASEWTMFKTITLQLTTPILAVLSLNAFVQAYSGFMWAFVVCQDKQMWTLMVWLYQFQDMFSQSPHLIMAALVMASIPTLIIFMFCQKIILRGIVVPSMK